VIRPAVNTRINPTAPMMTPFIVFTVSPVFLNF
jgi:hypothetical protein